MGTELDLEEHLAELQAAVSELAESLSVSDKKQLEILDRMAEKLGVEEDK